MLSNMVKEKPLERRPVEEGIGRKPDSRAFHRNNTIGEPDLRSVEGFVF